MIKGGKAHQFLRHGNVVGFISFCTLPYAIMLENLAFHFSLFGHTKLITNLGDCFKVFNDRLDGKIFSDIAVGLAYLQEREIAHRDLKPKTYWLATSITAT